MRFALFFPMALLALLPSCGSGSDEPVLLTTGPGGIDAAELERLERAGLVRRDAEAVVLTDRGRFVGDAVTAALLA